MSDASKIETNGVNPVPDNERYGRPFDLFPVWFSWNISIFGITLGIYVFGLGLSVWQAMLAGVIGYFLSCALVGILAVGSVRAGTPIPSAAWPLQFAARIAVSAGLRLRRSNFWKKRTASISANWLRAS